MNARYQVFVSSTYDDLLSERQQVMQALLQLDCFPAGMELFPATDEEQFEFIKRVIDDCDYYLLVIGGRYGSITADGISYTEKEYDYAVSKGIPIIAFIHGNPDDIPAGKTEMNPDARERLDAFRGKVGEGRLIKKWDNPEELAGLVALSLSHAIKLSPGTGWVRGDIDTSGDLLSQINELRKQNEEYREKISTISVNDTADVSSLSQGQDQIEIIGIIKKTADSPRREWSKTCSWDYVFSIIGPELFANKNETLVEPLLAKEINGIDGYVNELKINKMCFNSLKVQFIALGLIDVTPLNTVGAGVALFWGITEHGKKYLMNMMALRRDD